MATHYYAVTWDQLHRDARALAWRLMDKGPFAGIVAITRGGLIPAAIIARELDVRLVESVSIVTYAAGSGGTLIEEENSGAPVVIKPPAAAGDGTGFLIVDDLVDTGSHGARGARAAAAGAFRRGLCQAGGARRGGRLHHRGVAGHLDPVPVGHRAAVRCAAGGVAPDNISACIGMARSGVVANCYGDHSNTATARIGLAVPPRIFSGKPMKRKRPRPTSLSRLARHSMCVMPRSAHAMWAR